MGQHFLFFNNKNPHSYPTKNHLRKGRLTNLHSLVDDLRDANFCPDGISILHNAVTMGGADFAVDDPNAPGPKLGSMRWISRGVQGEGVTLRIPREDWGTFGNIRND